MNDSAILWETENITICRITAARQNAMELKFLFFFYLFHCSLNEQTLVGSVFQIASQKRTNYSLMEEPEQSG